MVESIVNGTIYLKKADQSFYSTEGTSTSFSGTFGLVHDIPFYFLNISNPGNPPNPHEIHSYGRRYSGRLYLLETPSIGVGSKKVTFEYGLHNKFILCENNKLIVPLTNVAYLEYSWDGSKYIAIPTTSISAIQYRFIM